MHEQRAVWVTRAEPGATATATCLHAMGFLPLLAPLLTVQRLELSFSLNGVGALAFTSANGVRAFAALSDRRDLKVFAVGDATANSARAAGFKAVASANGDGAALVRMIVQSEPVRRVLCPGPRQRAGDVPGALRRAGVAAEALVLYETTAQAVLPDTVGAALAAREVGAVLIHSARAGEACARLVAPHDLAETAIIGLSTACLRPFTDLPTGPQIVARAPREDSLLEALLSATAPTLGKPPLSR